LGGVREKSTNCRGAPETFLAYINASNLIVVIITQFLYKHTDKYTVTQLCKFIKSYETIYFLKGWIILYVIYTSIKSKLKNTNFKKASILGQMFANHTAVRKCNRKKQCIKKLEMGM
jgi:hypothetical protein